MFVPWLTFDERASRWHGCVQAALTGALGARDKSLARVAHLEDGGRLDVVPLLEGHGVHPAVSRARHNKAEQRTIKKSQHRCGRMQHIPSPPRVYHYGRMLTCCTRVVPKQAASCT